MEATVIVKRVLFTTLLLKGETPGGIVYWGLSGVVNVPYTIYMYSHTEQVAFHVLQPYFVYVN